MNEAPETSTLLQHVTLQTRDQKSQCELGGLAGAQSSTLEPNACDLGFNPCLQASTFEGAQSFYLNHHSLGTNEPSYYLWEEKEQKGYFWGPSHLLVQEAPSS